MNDGFLQNGVSVNIEGVMQAKGRHVETVVPDTPILDVCQRMRMKNIGALVVTKDGQRIDGIITERDVVSGLAREGAEALRKSASHLMTKSVITCAPDDHLTKVMAIITSRRIRHLPVVVDGRLAGIVSIGDLLKTRLEEVELEANVLRDVYLAGH
jgi:CBS domain-containing protein